MNSNIDILSTSSVGVRRMNSNIDITSTSSVGVTKTKAALWDYSERNNSPKYCVRRNLCHLKRQAWYVLTNKWILVQKKRQNTQDIVHRTQKSQQAEVPKWETSVPLRKKSPVGRGQGHGRESGWGGGEEGRGEPDLTLKEGKGLKPWGPAESMETGNLGR